MQLLHPLYDRAVDLLRAIYNWRITAPPVLDAAVYFPQAARFSEAWPQLRCEALQLAQNIATVPRFHEIMPQQAAISAHDARDWRMFVLKAYGVTVTGNMSQCPTLSALVRSSPSVLSAALSFLAPGKQVPVHRGPFRGVIRYYLALSVPLAADGQPGTVLTIDGIEHRIANGQSLLWDDTFEHAVRNDTNEVRIALLLDVRRPAMPISLALLSDAIIAAVGIAVKLRLLFSGKINY